MEAQMQKGQAIGNANYGYATEPAAPQSEVDRELMKLLEMAETLDSTVGKFLCRIEKVTRSEPPMADGTKGDPIQVCATILGRDLSNLNTRIRCSMLALQSAIQRIEL